VDSFRAFLVHKFEDSFTPFNLGKIATIYILLDPKPKRHAFEY
jgi:hypothetical protein